jgi:hypothetical protein
MMTSKVAKSLYPQKELSKRTPRSYPRASLELAPTPSPIRLHWQALPATQREEKREARKVDIFPVMAGEGGGGAKPIKMATI